LKRYHQSATGHEVEGADDWLGKWNCFEDCGLSSFGRRRVFDGISSVNDAEMLVEEGFDVREIHISCHPLHAQSITVSIMDLRSYIKDEEIVKVLSQYGEFKGDVSWFGKWQQAREDIVN